LQPSLNFSDTGETFGIIPSKETGANVLQNEDFDLILLGDEGATADASDDEVSSNSDIETESKQRLKSGKGNAAAWLATMEGTKTMAKKIAGEHEKNKFWDEYNTYDSRGEHGVRDWSIMADAWNEFVAKREKTGQNEIIKYYRKHAHMLESFFESGAKSNNIKATLQPHMKSLEDLSKVHRVPVAPPITALSAPGPLATHGPNSITTSNNKDHSNMVSSIPMPLSKAPVLTLQKNGPLIYPGQVQQFRGKKIKKRSLDRAPQLCTTCRHYRHHNSVHNKSHLLTCTVPSHLYNVDQSKGWCPCSDCVEGAANVGYEKPIQSSVATGKRALKTCTLCGHYKDYGFYQRQHVNKTCTVEKREMRNKYKGYCNCNHCEATAFSMGRDKPLKIRKIYDEVDL
jgi:hypothetical protein